MQRTRNSIFNDTIGVYRFLESSAFASAEIVNCVRNTQRKTLTIKYSDASAQSKLLKITALGKYSINCSLPIAEAILYYRYGVIGPFSPEVDAKEVKEILKKNGHFVTAERIVKGKGDSAEPTS